jgi:hypothetical protein
MMSLRISFLVALTWYLTDKWCLHKCLRDDFTGRRFSLPHATLGFDALNDIFTRDIRMGLSGFEFNRFSPDMHLVAPHGPEMKPWYSYWPAFKRLTSMLVLGPIYSMTVDLQCLRSMTRRVPSWRMWGNFNGLYLFWVLESVGSSTWG